MKKISKIVMTPGIVVYSLYLRTVRSRWEKTLLNTDNTFPPFLTEPERPALIVKPQVRTAGSLI